MIASLNGVLSYKSTGYIIIDVHGIGYEVSIPLSTFYKLPDTGEMVRLAIHTHVKEDSISLFGFFDPKEREIFHLIISVSGIGPRLAINMLSGIAAGELLKAISTEDIGTLMNIPGIGKKTAERLIFELKDKIPRVVSEAVHGEEPPVPVKDDALSALVNLGYNSGIAKKAVERVLGEYGERPTLESLITESLKILSS
jgi:Holliday junction DNA helicase RuvA